MAKQSTEEQKSLIVALLEELRGAEIAGDEGRIVGIKESLRRAGYQAEKPSKRAEKRPYTRRGETR